jgi:hypothetical protein
VRSEKPGVEKISYIAKREKKKKYWSIVASFLRVQDHHLDRNIDEKKR